MDDQKAPELHTMTQIDLDQLVACICAVLGSSPQYAIVYCDHFAVVILPAPDVAFYAMALN